MPRNDNLPDAVPVLPALALLGLVFLLGGCAFLLPKSDTTTESPFNEFPGVQLGFEKVVAGKTKLSELSALGFDPVKTPNIRRLTYPELMVVFLPNPSLRLQDVDPAVRRCFAKRDDCYGLQLRPEEVHNKRVGNAFLDIFGFRRETHTTGWYFQALFVVQGETVVYKLWSGETNVFKTQLERNPLGPLQNVTPSIDISN
ncbi:MAG: hypothetical protein ACRETN_00640 [Nevskiales bacterium]